MDGKSLRAALVGSLLLCVLVPASASADYNRWYLRNANTTGAHQVAFNYGDAAQTPLAGDWDGDGFDTPGLFGSSSAVWWLANSFTGSADASFMYGSPGFTPVVGDWNGNGNASVGVKTGGRWHVSNSNSGLPASSIFTFGNPSGDIPLAGDWDGNGTETPGLYRTGNRAFYLSNSATGSLVSGIVLGIAGDVPVVGDWNGDGSDSIGVFRSSNSGWYLSNGLDGVAEIVFAYGSPGDRPVVGDWDGNGTDTPGVVRRLAGASSPLLVDPSLIREQGSMAIYQYVDGERYLLTSPEVVPYTGLSQVFDVSAATLAAIPRGEDISLGDAQADGDLEIYDPETETDSEAVIAGNSSYKLYRNRLFDFVTDDGRVAAVGTLKWFRGRKKRTIVRGQFAKSSALHPQQPVGCMWAKLKWGFPLGSFSLPSPTVSINAASTEGEYAVKCRKSGDDYPPPLKLAGIAYAKRWLNSVTIEICHSATRADGPRHCAWEKIHYSPSDED
jgi:hypothetical protein